MLLTIQDRTSCWEGLLVMGSLWGPWRAKGVWFAYGMKSTLNKQRENKTPLGKVERGTNILTCY